MARAIQREARRSENEMTMTGKRKKPAKSAASDDMSVEAFMKSLDHPGKTEMLAVR